jgi:hypothetical protein
VAENLANQITQYDFVQGNDATQTETIGTKALMTDSLIHLLPRYPITGFHDFFTNFVSLIFHASPAARSEGPGPITIEYPRS